MGDACDSNKYFCPRLLDYVILVGARKPNSNNDVAQTPELLRRYPQEEHADFVLPPDVVFFCQPEGCHTVSQKRYSLRQNTSFVFTLTDKETSRVRFGICVNFYRPFRSVERKLSNVLDTRNEKLKLSSRQNSSSNDALNAQGDDIDGEEDSPKTPKSRRKHKQAKRVRNNSLTSLCIISHHPFISTFRECLFILKRLIDSCNERSSRRKVGGSRSTFRESIWGILAGLCSDIPPIIKHDVKQIETWILRLLSAPVPVPGKTRVEMEILDSDSHPPFVFALPDHTRFSLADFPLHLPLELLGIDTCLKVLTLIIMENKVVLQSKDYNALSMSVMAFVSMIYPLEYMFPVIPLLPTCMGSAEQLLLAPTPFLIGVPATFFRYKPQFLLPDDVWLVDLDANKITKSGKVEIIPILPEPEEQELKTHLKQALASMSLNYLPPIKDFDKAQGEIEAINRQRDTPPDNSFNKYIFGNDVDSVDVATRVAMVKFLLSPNVLGNHTEHTRTLRLHPRPVVAFQVNSFLASRPIKTDFIDTLSRTQAVEYFGEYCLNPTNHTFLRIQTGLFDPQMIGDKQKWFRDQLAPVPFAVYFENCTLTAAVPSNSEEASDSSNPTDESGESEPEAESDSSSYSSLDDLVTDMMNSDIKGDVQDVDDESPHVFSEVDEHSVYQPPDSLQIPQELARNDSSQSLPDSDSSSSQEMHMPRDLSVSSFDTDQDLEGSMLDSETGTPRRRRKKSSNDGRNSPSFIDKVNAFFRSDSSDSSTPPSPTKTNNKPSLLNGLMTFALDPGARGDMPTSPTSVKSERNGYPASIRSDPGPPRKYSFNSSATTTSMGLPPRPKKTNSSFTRDTRRMMDVRNRIKHRKLSPANDRPNSEDQVFLKEITRGVLEGNNVGWLNWPRLKKLMQNENLRAQVISQLNPQDNTIKEEHIDDVKVEKAVYKGMVSILRAIISGIEHSYENHTPGGMASTFALLEMAHTHYFGKEPEKVDRRHKTRHHAPRPEPAVSDQLRQDETSLNGSFDVVDESDVPIGSSTGAGVHGAVGIATGVAVTADWMQPVLSLLEGGIIGNSINMSPLTGNGDQPENTTIPHPGEEIPSPVTSNTTQGVISDIQNNNTTMLPDQGTTTFQERIINMDGGGNPRDIHGSVMTDPIVLSRRDRFRRNMSSIDSEVSEASTLVSFSSDTIGDESDAGSTIEDGKLKRPMKISHQPIRTVLSDSEIETSGVHFGKKYARQISAAKLGTKSCVSAGFRYHKSRMIATEAVNSEIILRHYIFEALTGKDRSLLWDQQQFWEDAFLDAVAAERDAVGMDQGPAEMMNRYDSLTKEERRRLEMDEDKLLSDMLYNMSGFMVMMKVPKPDVKKKVRRLLGRSHVGLIHSQSVNDVLDQVNNLHGNDIDLKPSASRQMRKHSFVVHSGSGTNGDVLFMEVCDDCIIIRSGNGAVCDRCWYERLINMSFCPKTKVLCLSRKGKNSTRLDKFYTKKCKELYHCIKETMEKAANRQKNGIGNEPDLGGEFPIQDMRTGEGGLLQVTMEGVGLKFPQSKTFIELKDIKEYKTKKDVFMLVEFNQQSKGNVRHKFQSNMAHEIGYAMLCVFSYIATAKNSEGNTRKEMEARMAGRRREFMTTP
ncbi:MAP kinase-activating death domain protein-like isoform X4 [Apostichopus japonicus]|uniref:MAP kinase-activating death domain protein-like isoform X4 n=1 Tax=Stichopus japonicus TaxID=307972 RepID=UPI003AB31D1F